MAKILIISPSYTHPTTAGNRKCILDYCTLLSEMGHEIYFLLISDDKLDNYAYTESQSYWGNKFFHYQSSPFRCLKRHIINRIRKHIFNYYWKIDDWCPNGICKYINNLNKKYNFDAAIVNYVYLSKIVQDINIKKVVLYTHDCFLHKSKRVGFNADFSLEPSEESKGLMRCKNILSIQENETQLFRYLSPLSNVYTVYSYFKYDELPLTGNMNLLFFSGPNVFNVNGIKHFIFNIYPHLKNEIPQIKLLVGGKICDVIKKWDLPNDIELKGEYDNQEEFYRLGDIAINPVYQGTGLKIKTFESLSYGRITIVHEHSCEGVYKKETSPLLIANTSENYIKHINTYIDIEARRKMQTKIQTYMMSFQQHVKNEFKKALEL